MTDSAAGEEPPKVVVVLPTYNERENITRMLPALCRLRVANLHILIVDDNSPDGTGKLADELTQRPDYARRLSVLHRPHKRGLGPAYIAGFKRALAMKADLIIGMDADFSHQPERIPALLRRAADCDMVIGSRYAPGGSVDNNWGVWRKLLSYWANRVYAPLILGLPVRDATGGFRVFHRAALIGIDLDRVRSNGYVFLVEMVYVAQRLGYAIGEVPIHFPDRAHGQSKMSSRIALEAALRVWQIRWRHRRLSRADRRARPYLL
ncbi:MAG: polyprenol monophosphomannose synthase [Chloroflexi bacterium]|nr:polyprenol monophosphomannose synthase [Chloroflexota bacterium]MCY4247833.1 polyprenol monophosphomannose synthase [Chloroflexota bacterium]